MRLYSVPFSAKEEEKFFGLTLREVAIVFAGALVGVFFVALIFMVIGRPFMPLLLLVVPFAGAGYLFSRWPVREIDHTTTLDRHLQRKLKYRLRTKIYVYFR